MGNAVAAILITGAVCLGDAHAEPPVLQQRYDATRARSWSLTRDGVLVHDALFGRKTPVRLSGWVWLDAPYCAPDLVLAPSGEAVVTSNVLPTLWRIDGRTLAVSVRPLVLDADTDKDFGFAAIVYSPDQRAYLAYSDLQRTLWKIDTALTTGTQIRQAQRAAGSLSARCRERREAP